MAIEKRPRNPIPRGSPLDGQSYKVKDNDSWASIARQHNMDAWELIEFNFKTRDPAEINWYLCHFVGCKKQTHNGKNWLFSSTDTPGIIYIPRVVINMPPISIKGEVFCKDAPQENYPYTDNTFKVIELMSDTIKDFSRRHGVPPVAVAGSIADEYNTRTGVKSAIDWFQDRGLLNYMPNFFIEVDAWIGINSKFLNATMHDIGKGNIKLQTAKDIYDLYKYTFKHQSMDYAELVDYILTDRGTIHVATLVIKKAKQELDQYLNDYPDEVKEAIYVTYYKQGSSYVQRFRNAHSNDAHHRLKPGEGCRVFLQRDRFIVALKLNK